MLTLPVMRHPVIKFRAFGSLKLDYVYALDYFVRKYGNNIKQAEAEFEVYKNKLLKNLNLDYAYCGDGKALEIVRMFFGQNFGVKEIYYRFYKACLFIDALFITSRDEPDRAGKILEEICGLVNKRYIDKIFKIFDYLYGTHKAESDTPLKMTANIKYQLECWDAERNFKRKTLSKILFTASMSAGKSMLINAIIGKRITRTQSEACTGKIHYIYNKPYEDGLTAKLEGMNFTLDASESELMHYDDDNKITSLKVWTYFIDINLNNFCLVDTPGVNFSLNAEHAKITHNAIKAGNYDYLVYLVNAEYAGTDDDRAHLEYVFKNAPVSKVIFVLNKLDRFNLHDDSITETINELKADLIEIGFKEPVIFPLSAYAAMLAKRVLLGDKLTEDKDDEFKYLVKKFKMPEFDLSAYTRGIINLQPEEDEINNNLYNRLLNFCMRTRRAKLEITDNCKNLLIKSGLASLERFLNLN